MKQIIIDIATVIKYSGHAIIKTNYEYFDNITEIIYSKSSNLIYCKNNDKDVIININDIVSIKYISK